jgi:hypothetical protein
MLVVLKRNLVTEFGRFKKSLGPDEPTEVPDVLRGRLPRDAVIIEGGDKIEAPAVFASSSAHKVLNAAQVHDSARAEAAAVAEVWNKINADEIAARKVKIHERMAKARAARKFNQKEVA